MDPNTAEKFCKARLFPYSMKTKVAEALEQLEKEGNIAPVQDIEWEAPLVPILKPDGKIIETVETSKLQ